MRNPFVGREKICFWCGIGTWVLCVMSFALMKSLNIFFSRVLLTLWVATALCAVVFAIGIRCGIGTKKNGFVRAGMILGTAMLAFQGFSFVMMFREAAMRESEGANTFEALFSLVVVLFVVSLCTFLYLFLARKAQTRIEERPVKEKGDRR